MSVIEQIVEWASTLPSWQADALRRLIAGGGLSAKDDDELLAMLEAAHGFRGDRETPPPVPIAADYIPHPTSRKRKVVLRRMFDLAGVNALAPNQAITFLSLGITVIYGNNASGKSGYSRVLKRACRARDRGEEILPNVFSDESAVVCSASFDVEVDGEAATVRWVGGGPPPEELSTVAVFDARCARLYVDEEDRVVYQPYGLDILPQLVDLCGRLRGRLERERDAFVLVLAELGKLPADTAGGGLVRNPSLEGLRAFVGLTDREIARREQVRRLVTQLRSEDSRVQVAERTRKRDRLAKLEAELGRIAQAVAEDSVGRLRSLATELAGLNELREKAAQALAGEPLSGVGGDVWRRLYVAARAYSEEVAYSGMAFPVVADESLCVLCQQPLDAEARDRMMQFQAFVSSTTETSIGEVEAALKTALGYLQNLTFDPTSGDSSLGEELSELDATLAAHVEAYAREAEARAEAIVRATSDGSWDSVPALAVDVASRVTALVSLLGTEVEALKSASEPAAMAALEAELRELDARDALHQRRDSLETDLKLQQCMNQVKTTGISRKQSELTDAAVTEVLREALQSETASLGFAKASFTLSTRTRDGKSYSQLELATPMQRKVPLSAVLSEGEQTVVAIASFFAELRAGAHTCGVVFDDPVCSLDHLWRDRIARRFAEEGRIRQVIVFTHDVGFVLALQRQAAKASCDFRAESLHADVEGTGICEPGLPELAMSVRERVSYLRRLHASAVDADRSGDQERHRERVRECYRVLRGAWERLVEEVLLAGTVVRYGHSVQTQRLADVFVNDPDYEKVYFAMELCSERFEGHDRGADRGDAICTLDEVLADIEELESFRKELEKRRKETGSRRRAKVKPPVSN